MSPTQELVLIVIVATAVTTSLLVSIIFYFLYRYALARQNNRFRFASSFPKEAMEHKEFLQQDGAARRIDVDDVLYLHKLESGEIGRLSLTSFDYSEVEEKMLLDLRRDTTDLLGPTQKVPSAPRTSNIINFTIAGKPSPTLPPLQPSQPTAAQLPCYEIPATQKAPPPPPPPPPPPIITKKFSLPVTTVVPAKRKASVPLSLIRPVKPLTASRGKVNKSRAEALTNTSPKRHPDVQMKMKPLHWDKVATNVDHSVVWNEINSGSFTFDHELIEALFGYASSNQKLPEAKNNSSTSTSCSSTKPTYTFILDPRRSQNIAIVLKSLTNSSKQIQDALLEGQGLDSDTLEKLTTISPTEEETAKILQFNENPKSLAYAESFLYQILKSVPSAFIRINAMLFRSNYDPEILHLKESLQTLEFGCKELRARGIFLKLLEAILRAGNHMNAGTARGNAKGFNLSALQKISYVKSTDGKTTLLQFVVEQIALAEGKRCVMNRQHSSGRNNTLHDRNNDQDSDRHREEEQSEKDYIKLGLPVLGNLSNEFFNVTKAASIDHDTLMNKCPNLTFRVSEIQQLVTRCCNDERCDFVKEMKGFTEDCEEELKVVREEQARTMKLVKRTTEFYQAGASNDKGAHPLQIFIIVRDFLDMVDHACTDITRKLQKSAKTTKSSTQPLSPSIKASLMFHNLQLYIPPAQLESNSFISEEDF